MVQGCLNMQGSLCSEKTHSAQHQLSGRRSVMVKVKTGPFICSCWAKCILGSQSGGIAPDCTTKAREPICGGKMSPCHTAQHLCIFLSLTGNLQSPSAVTLSLCLYICFPSFPFCISTHVSLSQAPHHLQLSVFQIIYYLPLNHSFFHIVSGSTVLQIVHSQLGLFLCLPHSISLSAQTFSFIQPQLNC